MLETGEMGHLVGSVNGSGVSFCGDENILELGSCDGYTTLRRLKKPTVLDISGGWILYYLNYTQ